MHDQDAQLRIAVPNKGSLSETAAEMLAEAGYAGRRDPKTLHVIDADNADALFDDAVTQLLALQRIAPPADLPGYDEALLARELKLDYACVAVVANDAAGCGTSTGQIDFTAAGAVMEQAMAKVERLLATTLALGLYH